MLRGEKPGAGARSGDRSAVERPRVRLVSVSVPCHRSSGYTPNGRSCQLATQSVRGPEAIAGGVVAFVRLSATVYSGRCNFDRSVGRSTPTRTPPDSLEQGQKRHGREGRSRVARGVRVREGNCRVGLERRNVAFACLPDCPHRRPVRRLQALVACIVRLCYTVSCAPTSQTTTSGRVS